MTAHATIGDTIRTGQIWHKTGNRSHRIVIWLAGDARIGATRLGTGRGGHVELTPSTLRARYTFVGISEPRGTPWDPW